ncbi:MAG: LysR family transcriptional regulator, partial [Bradyrhizobium sp.]
MSRSRAAKIKLVDRRARTYTLTEDGRRLAAAASPMEHAAFAIERAVVASRPGLTGEVSISAPPTLANRIIAPRLVELRRQHPAIA